MKFHCLVLFFLLSSQVLFAQNDEAVEISKDYCSSNLLSRALRNKCLNSGEFPVIDYKISSQQGERLVSTRFTRVKANQVVSTFTRWREKWIEKMPGWTDKIEEKSEVVYISGQRNRQYRRTKKDLQKWIRQNSKRSNIKEKSVGLNRSLSKKVLTHFRTRFPRVKGEDVWIAMVRTGVVGGSTGFLYIYSNTPIPASLMVAAATGLASGGMSLFMKYWEDFLDRSNKLGKYADLAKTIKFGVVEVGFLMIPPLVLIAFGERQMSYLATLSFLSVLAGNTILTTATQGWWETNIQRIKAGLKKKGRSTRVLGVDIMSLGALSGSLIWVATALVAEVAQAQQSAWFAKVSMVTYTSFFVGAASLYMASHWEAYSLKEFFQSLKSKAARAFPMQTAQLGFAKYQAKSQFQHLLGQKKVVSGKLKKMTQRVRAFRCNRSLKAI